MIESIKKILPLDAALLTSSVAVVPVSETCALFARTVVAVAMFGFAMIVYPKAMMSPMPAPDGPVGPAGSVRLRAGGDPVIDAAAAVPPVTVPIMRL